jgi:hypothetical protein
LGCVIGDAQRPANGAKVALLKKPQQDGVASAAVQRIDGFIQRRPQMLPIRLGCRRCFKDVRRVSFPRPSPPLPAQHAQSREACAPEQPPCDHSLFRHGGGLPGQVGKHRLGHISRYFG